MKINVKKERMLPDLKRATDNIREIINSLEIEAREASNPYNGGFTSSAEKLEKTRPDEAKLLIMLELMQIANDIVEITDNEWDLIRRYINQ